MYGKSSEIWLRRLWSLPILTESSRLFGVPESRHSLALLMWAAYTFNL